jgi:hypothetical protein
LLILIFLLLFLRFFIERFYFHAGYFASAATGHYAIYHIA